MIVVGQRDTATLAGERYWFLDEMTAVRLGGGGKELRDGDPVFRGAAWCSPAPRPAISAGHEGAGRPPRRRRRFRPPAVADGLPRLLRRDRWLRRAAGSRPAPAGLLTPAGEGALADLIRSSRTSTMPGSPISASAASRAVGDFVEGADVGQGFAQALWDVIAGDALQSTGMGDGEVAAFSSAWWPAWRRPSTLRPWPGTSASRPSPRRRPHRLAQLRLMAWRCHRPGATCRI